MKSRGGAPFGRRILETDPNLLKFIYSEKATKFCKISTIDLSYVVPVKSTVEISQNFVAFSEYMNFMNQSILYKVGMKKKHYVIIDAIEYIKYVWYQFCNIISVWTTF